MNFLSSAVAVRARRRGLLGSMWVGSALPDKLPPVHSSHWEWIHHAQPQLPRGQVFPCTGRAGFPWSRVSLVPEGLAEGSAGTQLLPGHAPATPARAYCHVAHVSCWWLPMERPLQKKSGRQRGPRAMACSPGWLTACHSCSRLAWRHFQVILIREAVT